MQLQEIIRRAEKELSTATRSLEMAKFRGAPDQDVWNLEAKVEYRKAVLDILNGVAGALVDVDKAKEKEE